MVNKLLLLLFYVNNQATETIFFCILFLSIVNQLLLLKFLRKKSSDKAYFIFVFRLLSFLGKTKYKSNTLQCNRRVVEIGCGKDGGVARREFYK